jgi:Domain of unknown function (DUF4149)
MLIILSVYLIAIACWLGGIVFFSFFTTRIVFASLPRPEAGVAIRALFPQYYMLGYIAGTISLVLAIYITAVWTPRLWWGFTTFVLAVALGLTFYAGTVIRPRVEAIRSVTEEANPDPVRKAEFDKLHRMSVMLNGAVLLLNIAAVVGTAGALTARG